MFNTFLVIFAVIVISLSSSLLLLLCICLGSCVSGITEKVVGLDEFLMNFLEVVCLAKISVCTDG